MKKVLYITNIEAPYRVKFFNLLAEYCDLTVLCERKKSSNRDTSWSECKEKKYNIEYLEGINVGNEYTFSTHIIGFVKNKWDFVIVGCYNSKVQMLAIATMKLCGIPFYINLDGEPFFFKGIKSIFKKAILRSANGYLVAGVKACNSVKFAIGDSKPIIPYYFSSLSRDEIVDNSSMHDVRKRFVLVVGQYFDYKGMDIALKVAEMDNSINYKFVGMGKRTDLFKSDMGQIPNNVQIIPFLQKDLLNEEYKHCSMLLLPTRQECWGLVVNEAASFGTPIVSTWGSGAAVEFLSDKYPQYLAKAGDAISIMNAVRTCLNANNQEYGKYLIEKSLNYNIERMVEEHINIINLCKK